MAAIIPNLCGASKEFNDFLSQFDDIEDFLLRNLDTAITAIKAQLDILFTDLGNFLRKFVGELPEFPSLNLQALIGDLLSIDISLPAGLRKYLAMIKSIADDFGEFLEAAGFALETLISDALKALTDGFNICGAVPDMRKTAAGEFGRFSNAVTYAQGASKVEEVATSVPNTFITEQRTLLALQKSFHDASLTVTTDFTAITPAGTPYPVYVTTIEDSLTSTEAEIIRNVEDKAFSRVSGKRTPYRKSISTGEVRARYNISSYGFESEPVVTTEVFRTGDLESVSSGHIIVSIAPLLKNTLAPFAAEVLPTTYVKIIILSSDNAVPITPSPKYTSNFPASTS